jgi:hypothetical protein
MKKILSNIKTVIGLLVVSIISLGFYIYMIVRPVSYGMKYHTEYEYEGVAFEGTLIFNADGSMVNLNTNFSEELISRYYYKDGYIFFTMAETDAEYEEEVEWINSNFEEAINSPFYASKINAFRLVSTGPDGFKTEYDCANAVVFSIVIGVIELMLIGLTCTSVILYKKTRKQKIEINI